MKATKIRLLACWDGYCGTCRDVRPLVLTQTGRFSLRAWWAGAGDEDRPLTMTCRVCGIGVHVPHEEDDPEPSLDLELDDELADEVLALDGGVVEVPVAERVAPADAQAPAAADADAELAAARTALATAMSAVARRSPASAPAPAPAPAAAVTPPRAGDHDDTDQALRLLAAGLETSHLVGEPARS